MRAAVLRYATVNASLCADRLVDVVTASVLSQELVKEIFAVLSCLLAVRIVLGGEVSW